MGNVIDSESAKSFLSSRATELLCPSKCQGMLFFIYTDGTVKCKVCGNKSKREELLNEY